MGAQEPDKGCERTPQAPPLLEINISNRGCEGAASPRAIPRKAVTFAEVPPVGLAITSNGQRYDLVGFDDHTKADGSLTKLARWRSECVTCGEPFETRCPSSRLPDNRRCHAHRQPGRRVWMPGA